MNEFCEALPNYYQMMLVNLASKAIQPSVGLETFVVELSDDFQEARRVKFGYASRMPTGEVLQY